MTEARSGENTKFSKNTGLYRGDISRYAILAGGTKGEKFMIKNVIELLGSQNIDPTDKMNALEQMVQYKTAYHRMRAEEEKKAYTGLIRDSLSTCRNPDMSPDCPVLIFRASASGGQNCAGRAFAA